MRSGTVSIVGRPNVGKSTLLNKILEKKIAITSDKAGTTRNLILGVYNDDDSQIVFVDTPGIHKPEHKLGNVLNKVDNIKKEDLIKKIDELKESYNYLEIIPTSAIKGINIVDLINTIKKYLPNDFKYYEDDYVTNQPKSLIITERVREKVLRLTEDEIPHTVTCVLETYEEKKDLLKLGVLIVIDRENIKKIIIGKNGSMLKKIGSEARLDLEEYFGKKVYLSLYVKVIKNWRDREGLIKELGLHDDIDED